jgi:uncharacterized protein
MDKAPRERIDPLALKAWFYSGLLWGLALLLIPVAYIVLVNTLLDWPVIFGWLGIGVVAVFTIFAAIIIPRLRMYYWRYEIHDDEIDIQHGIIVIKRTLIPMIRIQHVDTEHGPIMRYFKLATLRISTAATDHRIPALAQKRAAELRGEISALARVSDEDV